MKKFVPFALRKRATTHVALQKGNGASFPSVGEYQFSDGSQFKGRYENNKKSGLGDATYKKREISEEDGNVTTFSQEVNVAALFCFNINPRFYHLTI